MSQPNSKSAIDDVRANLERMGGQFKAVLPTQQHVDRFIRVVMTAVQGNLDLLEADRMSFYSSCMKCAQDGLMPDGKQAVLKIYKQNFGTHDKPDYKRVVQYEPMAEGLMMKLRNSGEIIGAPKVHVVHEQDEFTYELGDNERILHKPKIGARGKIIAAYSIVKLKSGDTSREVMGVDEIESVRQRSKQADSGPWKTDYGEMCRKTVFKRHYKRLPRSSDLDNVIRSDNEQNGLAEPIAPGTAVVAAGVASDGQAGQQAGGGVSEPVRRPAALEAVARAGGEPVPPVAVQTGQQGREPVTIDQGRQEGQQGQAEQKGPPDDII